MSSNRPGGWRGKTPQGTAARTAAPKGAGWARKPDQSQASAGRWHRLKLAGWLLVAVALVAGFLIYLMFRPLRTPLIVAAVTDYRFPLPPNAWAKEDVERLGRLDRKEVVACSEVAWDSNEQVLLGLREQLDGARPGGPGKDVVILYLSAHGFVDAEGEPCLVPPGAVGADSRSWLRLRELLDALFVKDRPGRPADKVTKLVVLDAGRATSDWSLGVLDNHFAPRVQRLVGDLAVPNLAVLCSSGAGQQGHSSPELGGSVFGYYFCRGMEGAADVGQGNADGKVSLQELSAYLTAQVAQWTVENRADVQTPVLVPGDAETQLAYAHAARAEEAPEPPGPDPRWSEVEDLWKRHAELAAKTPYRRDPLAWEEFQHKLLRLEQLLLAGSAYEDQFRQTKTELMALADTLAAQAAPRRLPAYSLPLAAAFGQWSPAESDLSKLPGPWKKAAEPPPEKPAGKAPPPSSEKPPAEPAKEAAPEKPATAKPAPKAPPPAAEKPKYAYLSAAGAAWKWCAEDPTKERLAGIAPFLDAAQGRPKADVVEVRLLGMAAAYLDWQGSAGAHLARAIEARQAAEQAAAPADIRAQYLVYGRVDDADAKRRLAEDKLFLGTDEALAEADALWQGALGDQDGPSGYRAAQRIAQRTAAALALRDRVWAEAPYLGQWLLARLRRDASSPVGDLRELTAAAHAISAELEKSLLAGARSGELDAVQDRLGARLAAIEKSLADENYRLRITAGEDQATLRAIGDLLCVPLVTGDDRNKLRQKYLRIARTRSTAPVAPSGSAPLPSGADEGSERLAKLMAEWGEHPALALLSRSGLGAASGDAPRPPRGGQPKALDAQGEAVRGLLASVAAETARHGAETVKALELDAKQAQSPAAVRAGRSKADLLVRAAAPLLGRRLWDDPRSNPTRQLEDLDTRHLLAWHSHRAIDDFWGPAGEGGSPYFQVVARDYLASARELAGRGAVLRYGSADLADLLARRIQAGTEGLRPKADDLLVSADEKLLPHKAAVAVPNDLPGGVAAYYLAMPGGEAIPVRPSETAETTVRRQALPVQAAGPAQLAYAVVNRQQLAETRSVVADVYFRGHAWTTDLYVQPARGLDIVFDRPKYVPPTVTVFGQAKQQVSVVFIFDCSGSMMRRLGGDENNPRRFDAARGALQAILLRLVGPDDPFRVGLTVYGDRCGWNPEEGKHNEMVVPDPANPERLVPAPPDFKLYPSVDVRPVQSVLPLTDKVRKQLGATLDGLRPLGETPLYLSIIQGLDMLKAEPKENRRHVIVVTDGFNEQSAGGPPGAIKYRKDVEDALGLPQNQGVQLDIVGVEVTAARPEEKQSLQDITELAAGTRGAFYPAQDPSSLLKALEKSLGLVQYAVEPLAGERGVPAGPAELGQPVTVEQPADRKVGYRVKLLDPERPAQAQIALEGGEGEQLYLIADGQQRRLVHRRYDRDLRADHENLAAPGDAAHKFYVGAHLPEWQGRAVRFPVSVQNQDAEQFSPRPSEAWVEIAPLMPQGKPAPLYIFYDLVLEPDRPVPVISCLAPNWPPEARLAEVRVWFSLAKTPPDLGTTLGKLARESPVLEDAPDVRFSVETREPEKPDAPYQVIVVERHPQGGRLDEVKVEMSPPPNRTIHRYQPEIGTVRHIFLYDNALADQVANYRVFLTTRKRLVERAASPAQPLRVAIPRTVVTPGSQT